MHERFCERGHEHCRAEAVGDTVIGGQRQRQQRADGHLPVHGNHAMEDFFMPNREKIAAAARQLAAY